MKPFSTSWKKTDLVICIDPGNQSIPATFLSSVEIGTIVIHMNDNYLRKNLIQSIGRGESITVRNTDHMKLCCLLFSENL